MMDWKLWLWRQKEGALVGGAWGVVSIYASVGLSSLPSIAFWQKIMILPVVIAGWFLPGWVSASVAIGAPILVGALIGVIVDSLYKPRE